MEHWKVADRQDIQVKIRPLDDRILVKRLEQPEWGPFAIPDTAKAKSLRGVVLAVGPGCRSDEGRRIPLDVKPGDVVYFGPYTDLERDDWVMIREADVRGIEG